MLLCFFFQAEDGIRDLTVTGVQTCALPISIFNTKTPHSFNTFLVDGRLAGTWRYEDERVRLEPFGRIPREARAELNEEAERLADFIRTGSARAPARRAAPPGRPRRSAGRATRRA